jgi:hypothetical protein
MAEHKIVVTINPETGAINVDTGDVNVVTVLGVAQLLTEIGNQKLREEMSKTVDRDKVSVK